LETEVAQDTSCWTCHFKRGVEISLFGKCISKEIDTGLKDNEITPSLVDQGCWFWKERNEWAEDFSV